MWVKGSAIDGEVALSMCEETESSRLVVILGGRVELREVTDCSEHRKLDSGHIGGEEIGGIEFKGEMEELKQEAKKEFMHSAFSEW